jgi:hypothetical protein
MPASLSPFTVRDIERVSTYTSADIANSAEHSANEASARRARIILFVGFEGSAVAVPPVPLPTFASPHQRSRGLRHHLQEFAHLALGQTVNLSRLIHRIHRSIRYEQRPIPDFSCNTLQRFPQFT